VAGLYWNGVVDMLGPTKLGGASAAEGAKLGGVVLFGISMF